MANNPAAREGSWLESITLFQAVREGEQKHAIKLLETSRDREEVTRGLLSLLGVYLCGEDPTKLDHFIAVSHRMGPPPRYGSGPYLPPM